MLIGLLRTIFIIIAVYYVVKFFFWLFRNPVQKRQNPNASQDYQRKKEGEVTIEYTPENKKRIRNDSGDYVDYEEVKED